MKTRVYVCSNGADPLYTFNMEKYEFVRIVHNQLSERDFFAIEDIKGRMIIVNPSLCSLIEISEVEE